jgi:hypothetical protein
MHDHVWREMLHHPLQLTGQAKSRDLFQSTAYFAAGQSIWWFRRSVHDGHPKAPRRPKGADVEPLNPLSLWLST